jgi:inner membrane protein
VDSLTHALVASIIFTAIGHPELVPFAALGAICPDVDFVFQRFSDQDPKLYIFTHGGITHSVVGALTTSAASTVLGLIAAVALGFSVSIPLVFVAAAAGVLTHIGLDFLAYPGIPLLWPSTDKKYTIGIAAGPTPYLLIASMVYGAFLLNGKASLDDPWLYAGFFVLVMTVAAVLKAWVTIKAKGMAIPGFNPLKWLIVADEPASYRVNGYHLLRGPTPAAVFEKLEGVSLKEVRELQSIPEVQRMRYHSYIVTVSCKGETITFADPLRENGYLWYPPYFKRYDFSPASQIFKKPQVVTDNAGKE